MTFDSDPGAPPDGAAFELLHADADLLVLNKPSGLLSVPGRGPDKQDCLSARVQRSYPDALIVHRLDMDTSGVLVMARGLAAQRTLNQAFAARVVHKRYQALVEGIDLLDRAEGEWRVIDLPIALDWPNRPLHIVDPINGKPSVSHWRVLHTDAELNISRLELEPFTGRTHQLRVHLSAIGHPILGDSLYAGATARARASRLLLHACELSVPHPTSGLAMLFVSPPPF